LKLARAKGGAQEVEQNYAEIIQKVLIRADDKEHKKPINRSGTVNLDLKPIIQK